MNYNKVTSGSTRIVFLFKNFVVKIPNILNYKLFLCGILANLQEKEFSCLHSDLADVIYGDKFGFVIIMKRALVFNLTKINWLKFKNLLEEKYKDDVLKEFMLSDSKPSNWGIINRKLVKIDYGN